MKKQTMMKILLVVLPVMAVALAAATDSVMVYDSAAGTTEYYSYFDLIPDCSYQILMPLAALLAVAAGILAVVYATAKKQGCLKGIVGTTFCGATAAVIPVLLQGDVMVVPNVGVAIFLFIECGLAYIMRKKPAETEEKQAERLGRK